jgi:uncharacterized RDD family membrane protein YckC
MEPQSPLKPAPLGVRALAAFFDSLIAFLATFYIAYTWGDPNPEGGRVLSGIPALLLMFGIAAFWILPEWLLSSSVGKWACDLRVMPLNGGRISFAQSLKRNVLRPLDFFPFYLPAFVTASLTPSRQRLGDLWAKTIVVSKKSMR